MISGVLHERPASIGGYGVSHRRMESGVSLPPIVIPPEPTVPQPPTFLSTSTASGDGLGTSVLKPAGVQSGDVLVSAVVADSASSALGASGWSGESQDSVFALQMQILTRVAGGAEPAFYNFVDVNEEASAVRVTILAYRPASETTLMITDLTQDSPSGTNHTTPTITPSADNSMLVVFGGSAASRSWTPPAGMTERSDAASARTLGAFDVVQDVAAAVSKTAVLSTTGTAIMSIIALTPVAA